MIALPCPEAFECLSHTGRGWIGRREEALIAFSSLESLSVPLLFPEIMSSFAEFCRWISGRRTAI